MRLVAIVVLLGCHGDPQIDEAPRDAARVIDPTRADAPVDLAIAIDAAPDAPIDAGPRLGTHGEVCRTADGKPSPLDQGRKVLDCGPGLSCCYPCGIVGCASVCHTAAECYADMRRP